MSKLLRKVFSFRAFRNFLSAATPFGVRMVRFFRNPYEDYKHGASLALDKNGIVSQINEHTQNIAKRLQPLLSENKTNFLEKAVEYLTPALEASAGDRTSFLLGDAGTHALAAVLKRELRDETYADHLKSYKSLYSQYLNPNFLKCGGDEFFVGRAGYLAGALWVAHEIQTQIFTNEELYKICDVMIASGREYSRKHGSRCPLMYHYYNTEYIGAAHGISFILQMLLSVPGYLEHNKSAAHDIKSTVDFIASLQTEEGNWPCCMEEIGLPEHKLVHWCHGAPGTVYLMAKAYLVFKDQKFRNACIKAGEVTWNKGLLRKGPGICHGVAGNGYVFLLLFRLTGDEKYLHRANLFAAFMTTDEFLRDARLPDNPESLYEGTAGTVCYLADLLVPDTAAFPFQNVFS